MEKERDALLAEKASWSMSSTAASEEQGTVDAEKVELTKARDEAAAQAKVRFSDLSVVGVG